MNRLKGYLAGLGVYAALLLLMALPIFPQSLKPQVLEQLIASAVAAAALVFVMRRSGFAAWLRDPSGAFAQSVLGIGVCCGLYSVLAAVAYPEILFMGFLLWTAVGLLHFGPRQVAALSALFVAIYLRVLSGPLSSVGDPRHADAVFMLIVSGVMGGFMFWRATEYQRVRDRQRLQEAALEDAENRIQEITTQDAETTALKYAYFRNQLIKEKARVDRQGGTFSVALIEIDRYDELAKRIGDTAASQLLREFTARTTRIVRKMDTLSKTHEDYKPLGRISGGRFSLMLPGADFEGAMRCAERLHSAVDFQAIRTHAGIVGLTLSIGFTEYAKREDTDELMELAARALMLAQKHNGNDFKGLKRPQGGVTPTRAGLETWNARPLAS